MRALLERPGWMWVSLTVFVVGVGISIVVGHRMGVMYVTVLPMQVASGMKAALSPAKVVRRGLVDWAGMKPLHSEHWGDGAG